MINLFCGYDQREGVGFHVFTHSVIQRASEPVSIVPLSAMGMPEGSNTFTLSRFLVPSLMGYQGHAIFADACDMLMLSDVAELDGLFDPQYAVQVVKHPKYKTAHKIKYKGTSMECPNLNYERKNWASLMIVNCGHESWRSMNLAETATVDALRLTHCKDEEIGELPDEWNRMVDEGHSVYGAKLMHWTAGIPAFERYKDAPGSELWRKEHAASQAVY